MAKFHVWMGKRFLFDCPGCKCNHQIDAEKWNFNGDVDKPTVSPSLLVNPGGSNPTTPICHSFIRDGKIQFLNDSTHELAGKTVDIPEWSE